MYLQIKNVLSLPCYKIKHCLIGLRKSGKNIKFKIEYLIKLYT